MAAFECWNTNTWTFIRFSDFVNSPIDNVILVTNDTIVGQDIVWTLDPSLGIRSLETSLIKSFSILGTNSSTGDGECGTQLLTGRSIKIDEENTSPRKGHEYDQVTILGQQ